MTCGADTLLGTFIRLFIPASVRLYTDKLAGDLLWKTGGWSESTLILTNESQITRLICVDQSQALKLVTEDRQTGTDKDGKSDL
jgi:hypothetical protein